MNSTKTIFKGFKKTSKCVLRKNDSKDLFINNKTYDTYFSDKFSKLEITGFVENLRSKGIVVTGNISCKGGGFASQLHACKDAILRSTGQSVRQDCRQRKRNLPGLRGVNKGAVHNKR